jgi:hypothetical protein
VTEATSGAERRVISQRREFAIIIVLSLLAVSMIAVASATNSYVPLFFAWVPYLGIPLIVARLDRARALASPAPPIGGPVRPADEDEAETPDVRSDTPVAGTTETDDPASDRDDPEDR